MYIEKFAAAPFPTVSIFGCVSACVLDILFGEQNGNISFSYLKCRCPFFSQQVPNIIEAP